MAGRPTDPIPSLDFGRQWAVLREPMAAALEQVGSSGWYVLGTEVEAFESALAEDWGLPYCVGVGNGMDAIEIGLRCLGLEPGDRVLTTPLSAFATTLAILRAGGIPVFVDVDPSGQIDLGQCARVLAADPSIRTMVPVHLWGHAFDLDRLEALVTEHGLRVVEDCAQAVGARWRGRPVGTVGQVAATSFYPTKNLGAMGDGGALLTADPQLADRARALRHYGQTATYVHDLAGLNSRLDELQAAFLSRVLLPRLHGFTARRRAIAERYTQGLETPRLRPAPPPAGSDSVWHLYPVLVADDLRDSLRAHLQAHGIGSGVHYPVLIPDQKAMETCPQAQAVQPLTTARHVVGSELSLPIHPFLTDDEVDRVVAACLEWRP